MRRAFDFVLWAGTELIRFWTRPRSAFVLIFRGGIGLAMISLAGGWTFNAAWLDGGVFRFFRFSTSDGAPATLTAIGVALGGTLSLIGLVGLVMEFRAEGKRRVLVIEQRGLAVRTDTPLLPAVSKRYKGRRVPINIDTTAAVRDGQVTDPTGAMAEIMHLRRDIRQAIGDTPPSDVQVVYGGLAPVPLTFLTGTLIDDVSAVTIMDWDRTAGHWRALDGADDGQRFVETGLDTVPREAPVVWLVVSQSYGADLAAVRALAGESPIVHLSVERPVPDTHWSEEKQRALLRGFRDTLALLEGRSVRRINLVLAAANSIVFRFGMAFDKRTMPLLVVCQYERSAKPAYPWGIKIPYHGTAEPELVHFPSGSAKPHESDD